MKNPLSKKYKQEKGKCLPIVKFSGNVRDIGHIFSWCNVKIRVYEISGSE
jgi:hypothetical protein